MHETYLKEEVTIHTKEKDEKVFRQQNFEPFSDEM